MENKIFLAPRLTGSRFEDHSLPISLLEDFSALEELIIELAKNIYLDQNPERKRVPKGFSEGIYLKLSGIEEGSTIPQFVLATILSSSSLISNPTESFKYVENARDKIIEVIEKANSGAQILLEQKYLNYFNRIGKSLLDDEAIDFTPTSQTRVLLNKVSRKRLLLSRKENLEYSETLNANALISSVDKKARIFVFEIDDNFVESVLKKEIEETVLTAFNEYEKHTLVSVKATGIYNSHDKLIRIEDVESIDILDPFDVNIRLSQLSKLSDNWYEGRGKSPNKNSLLHFGNQFKSFFDSKLPLPAIFPTIEGNIQLEWKISSSDLSLEIDLSNFLSNLFAFNTIDDKEYKLDLNKEDDWKRLNNIIEQYINE